MDFVEIEPRCVVQAARVHFGLLRHEEIQLARLHLQLGGAIHQFNSRVAIGVNASVSDKARARIWPRVP